MPNLVSFGIVQHRHFSHTVVVAYNATLMYDMCSDGHRLRFDDVAIHTQPMILIMDQWYMMHEHCHSTHDPDHSLLILLLVSLV